MQLHDSQDHNRDGSGDVFLNKRLKPVAAHEPHALTLLRHVSQRQMHNSLHMTCLSNLAGEASQTTQRSGGALPALVAPYAAYCGVGMPSAPAPSMLKMWPPEVCFCMTCMAALVHSSVPTMLVLTTCCNCSGEESMKACSSS